MSELTISRFEEVIGIWEHDTSKGECIPVERALVLATVEKPVEGIDRAVAA
jgi:hypothetical protein